MTSSIYLFPDTNVFLHCDVLGGITWHTCEALAEFDEIYLVICHPVLKEIDDLKYRNDWIARRAKKVSKTARALIEGKELRHVVRRAEPTVILCEETQVRPSPGLLDYGAMDERIVGCTYAYQVAHPDKDVRFLTHDAYALATARNVNVQSVMVPDQWRRNPPPSAAELRVVELEAEVKRLRQTEPQFDVQFGGPEGEKLDKIEGNCVAARSLTDGEISQLLSQLQSRFPRSSTSEWLEDCERVLRNLHTSIQHQSERLSVEIAIKNRGTVPAKDALVEIVGHGSILLGVPFDEDDLRRRYRKEPIRLPSPPSPFDNHIFRPTIDGLLDYSKLPPRDPNDFYYKPERPAEPVRVIALDCKQWRHESETEYFYADIYVDSESPTIEGSIECRIHAENLSKPVRKVLQVKLTCQPVDIAERAAQLVAQVPPRAYGGPGDFTISPY